MAMATEILSKLNGFIDRHGVRQWSHAAKKDANFMADVYAATAELPETTPFAERVYCAAYGDRPKCPLGGIRKLNSITTGWYRCGNASVCECTRLAVSEKTKATLAKKTAEDWKNRSTKTNSTVRERYGVENVGMLEQSKEAHRRVYSNIEKVSAINDRVRATMLDRHGVDNALKLKKIDRTHRRDHIRSDALAILDTPDLLEAFTAIRSADGAAAELGVSPSTINNYLRRYKINHVGSSPERAIGDFLNQLGIEFSVRVRNIISLELDFYLPDFKIAIEYNGLYYHTTDFVDNGYHQRKWRECHELGIRLLMINEDEMSRNPEVVFSKIRNVVGLSERGEGGRKLLIGEIGNSEAMDFCRRHHLQGSPAAIRISFGAFSEDKLVSVLTVGAQRGTGAAEITRFCTDGKTYAGVFSRLLKITRHCITAKLITFADLRYSNGDLYRRTGFDEVGMIRPDYRYSKNGKTFHKSLFTKKRIHEKFGIDMTDLTEWTAMESLGYRRIYDCGKIKFELQ